MKAAVYQSPGPADVLSYVDLPDPVCGPGDVLIAVEAISIEGGDLIHRRSSATPRPSYVLGFAAAGTIVSVGANVDRLAKGDRVTSFDIDGSHASLRVVRASRTWLIPEQVGMPEAAALPVSFGTAHHGLFARGSLTRGETVLVWAGIGGVGLAAIQLASQAGATVFAVASGDENARHLTRLGATHVIDRHRESVREAVEHLTSGRGVDVVVDPVGTTLQTSLAALTPEGRLVFVGNAGGDLHVDLWPALQANQSLLGVFMGTQFEKAAVHGTVERVLSAAGSGEFEVIIDRTFPLAEAARGHAYAETSDKPGRTILLP